MDASAIPLTLLVACRVSLFVEPVLDFQRHERGLYRSADAFPSPVRPDQSSCTGRRFKDISVSFRQSRAMFSGEWRLMNR